MPSGTLFVALKDHSKELIAYWFYQLKKKKHKNSAGEVMILIYPHYFPMISPWCPGVPKQDPFLQVWWSNCCDRRLHPSPWRDGHLWVWPWTEEPQAVHWSGYGPLKYVSLWLFNIAMEAMAHRNRWFSQRTKPPFLLRIFQFAMLVITRG